MLYALIAEEAKKLGVSTRRSAFAHSRKRPPLADFRSSLGNQAVLRMQDGAGHRPHSTCGCGGGGPEAGGECAECRAKREAAERVAARMASGSSPAVVREAVDSPGEPLGAETREVMESRLGHDFGHVRVHADSKAAESASAVNALAYTVGSDIVFAAGRYRPEGRDGRMLLAHELVHVVQQRGSGGFARHTFTPYAHPAEHEARSVSEAVADGRSASPVHIAGSLAAESVSLQMNPWACAALAALCLTVTEDPPVAAACWAYFARMCGGGSASAGGGASGTAVAGAEGSSGAPAA